MATNQSPLNLTELDFDEIKTNLKNFLRDGNLFNDYDFDGSNLSVLIDLLAYNTFYNAYYLNMVGNEMFLDTAVQRESVLSKAKELGYTPKSAVSSKAIVTLELLYADESNAITDPNNLPSNITKQYNAVSEIVVPKGTFFTSEVEDRAYTFSTAEAYSALFTNTFKTVGDKRYPVYEIKEVDLFEGELLNFTFPSHNSEFPEKFVVPNDNVDISSVEVIVAQDSSSVISEKYTRKENLFNLESDSKVFFLQPIVGNQYELFFGDGIFGKKLETGNIVTVNYRACDGNRSNGADSFTYSGQNSEPLNNVFRVTATSTISAEGGTFEETIESIKFNAPRHFQTQFRAVTAVDYQNLVTNEFQDFLSVKAFGGEEAEPPQFGKVFIAVRPGSGALPTDIDKNNVLTYLEDKKIINIRVEVIDPAYTFIGVETEVTYNPDITTLASSELESNITDEIVKFGEQTLGKFDNKLRLSKLLRAIDEVDGSINDSTTKFTFNTRLSVKAGENKAFGINLNNKIDNIGSGSVFSSIFNNKGSSVFISDNGEGILQLFRITSTGANELVQSNVGTVDYDIGRIDIAELEYTSFSGSFVTIKARPDNLNITPVREQILLIDRADVVVNASIETVNII